MIQFLLFLAQTTQSEEATRPPLWMSLVPWVLIGLVFYLLLIRPRRVEQQKHQTMLGALKKNDRVMTAGGIIGTVVSLKDDEVVLKVDESSNTKITFARHAIKTILSVQPGDPAPT
jgi:preprotein translocase subunit YajC